MPSIVHQCREIDSQCGWNWFSFIVKKTAKTELYTIPTLHSEKSGGIQLQLVRTLWSSDIISAMRLFVTDVPSSSTQTDGRSVNRCALCRSSGKLQRQCNSTKVQCQLCDRPVCGKHSQSVGYVCDDCCADWSNIIYMYIYTTNKSCMTFWNKKYIHLLILNNSFWSYIEIYSSK